MTEQDPLPPLRDVIRTYDLRAKKNFGQNFLLDLNLTRRIARTAGDLSESHVYEVGPGPGGLTRALLMEGAAHVTAVEMDSRCLPALADVSAAFGGRLSVIENDARMVDEPAVMAQHLAATAGTAAASNQADGAPALKRRVVSNLPYNVGTLLFVKWLTSEPWQPWFASLTLMFQKEVAERVVAQPGSKAYGRLSVLAQYRGKAKLAFTVPASAFTPPPKVESAIIHYEPREPILPGIELAWLEAVVGRAFQQRRKMLRASLKGLPVDAALLLEAAEIDPTTRADALSVMGYAKLAQAYGALLKA